MSFWEKIRELHIEKNKYFKLIVAVELCLLVVGVAGLFDRNQEYHYSADEASVKNGVLQEVAGGIYIDESCGEQEEIISYEGIALERGTYRVSLEYETDTHMMNYCNMTDNSEMANSFLCNGEHLYSGLEKTDFEIWVFRNKDNLTLSVDFSGTGNLLIKDLHISETNALSRMMLFEIIVAICLLNIVLLYRVYEKTYGVSVEDKTVVFGLGLVILFSSLPIMVNYMLSSGDLIYHLMRIVGVKDGLLQGQVPVRIAPEWLQGYGYASSIFYGETLISIASIFRLIGFPLVTSYRLYILVINTLTVIVSYYSFRKIFNDKYIGVFCSAVYTLSICRISRTFVCGALGETLGMLFLPLVVYGFYRVFTENTDEPSYKHSWIPLTIGFSGLIQSHLLSGEMAGVFTIILCFMAIRKVFRRKTFLVLVKTVLYTLILSGWFLVPFVDYMLRDDFVVQHVTARKIQSRGLYLAQLLTTYYPQGDGVFYDRNGLVNSQPMGVGIALWLPLLIYVGILLYKEKEIWTKKEQKVVKISAILAMISMIMSLSAFPWDAIQELSAITATLVSSLQIPGRMLMISTVSLTVVYGYVLKWFKEKWGVKAFLSATIGTVVLLALSSMYLMNSILFKTEPLYVYDESCIGSGYVSGAEYLPYGTDTSQLLYREPLTNGNLKIESVIKDGLYMKVECYNMESQECALEMPLLYYRGYKARDMVSNMPLPVYKGTNNVVGIAVPPNYEGTIEVYFQSPWYWRVSEGISLCAFLGLLISIWRRRLDLHRQ